MHGWSIVNCPSLYSSFQNLNSSWNPYKSRTTSHLNPILMLITVLCFILTYIKSILACMSTSIRHRRATEMLGTSIQSWTSGHNTRFTFIKYTNSSTKYNIVRCLGVTTIPFLIDSLIHAAGIESFPLVCSKV